MAGSAYRDLVVRIVGDAKGMTAATKQAETGLASFEKGLGKVQAALTSAFAGGMLVKFAKDSAQAALEDQRAQERLAKTLRNVVKANDEQVGAVERSIAKMESQFAVADDQLRPAFETLVRATKDVGQAQSLMQLALDVSAGSGKGLQEVTVALVKAMGGQMRGLKDLGINVKTATGDTASFADVQKQLMEMFTGQAAEAADSQTGRLKALGIQYDNLKESVGTALLPVLMQLADIANALFGWFNGLSESTQHLIAQVVIFGGIGLTAVKTFLAIKEAIQLMNISLAATPWGAIAAGIGVLASVFLISRDSSDDATESLDKYAKAVKTLGFDTESTTKLLNAFIQMTHNDMTPDATSVDTFGKALKALGLDANDTALYMKWFSDKSVSMDDILSQLSPKGQQFAESLKQMNFHAQELPANVETGTRSLESNAAATDKATTAAETFNKALAEQIRYQKIAEEKVRATTEAILKGADAVRAKFDTKFAADKAVVEYRAGLKSLDKDLKGLTKGTDEYNIVIEDQATKAFDAADALAKQAVAVSGLTDKNKIAELRNQTMIQSLEGMISTLDPNSPLRKLLEAYIAQLGQIPGTIVTDLALTISSVTGLTARQISDAALHRNDGRKPTRNKRAAGGPVMAGEMYTVGERGPETLVMGAESGLVLPYGSNAGGAGNVTVNVTAPQGTDPYTWGQTIVSALKAYVRTNGKIAGITV